MAAARYVKAEEETERVNRWPERWGDEGWERKKRLMGFPARSSVKCR